MNKALHPGQVASLLQGHRGFDSISQLAERILGCGRKTEQQRTHTGDDIQASGPFAQTQDPATEPLTLLSARMCQLHIFILSSEL